jgi:hypothetical protein
VELERLSVQLRPRGGWEALDLGFQMTRAWWRPIWGVWLAVYLPIAIALHVAFNERLWIAIAVLWWLKPAFERFVLHVVSRAVFGATPTVSETLAAWRDILRPGVIFGLTLYRIDLARSFMMPVWQLEKQTSKDATRRRSALGKRMRGYAVWLTVVCAHFEALALLSLGVVGALLAPAGADTAIEFTELFRGEGTQWDWIDSVCYVTAVSIVEPFYVAAGFSLYLNRRAVLEGWDIELQLRRLDQRLRAVGTGLAAAVLLALALSLIPAPDAMAEERSAKQQIQEVLKAPEFQQYRDTKRWRYRGEQDVKEREASSFWKSFGLFLADISQVVLWIAAGIGIIALALLARRYLPRFLAEQGETYRPPDTLFGLTVTPESLPDDIAGAAAALVRAGRLREALSLLYRGALSVLVHRDHVLLAEGDTESDCLRAAQQALPEAGGTYFSRLVHVWMAAAYANRLPDSAEAESLAREWTPHFAAGAARVAAEGAA